MADVYSSFLWPCGGGSLSGHLAALFQGGPETWMMEAGEYTVLRFTNLYELTCLGMVTKEYEVDVLATHIELEL